MSIVTFLVSFTVHAVAARWLAARTPWLRRPLPRVGLWSLVLVLSVLPATARIVMWYSSSRTFPKIFSVSLLEAFSMLLTVVIVALGSGVLRVARRVTKKTEAAAPETPAPAPSAPSAPSAPVLARREALEKLAGASVYGVSLATFGWGTVRGRLDFALEEVVVRIPGLPRALDGYVIAQVSDIHVGTFITPRELGMGFELVRRAKPDMVVATGDLVDFLAEAADPLARALTDVGARDGAFAIVGNHDHYAGPDEVIARLRRGGVRVLHDEGLVVRPGDGGGFALLGVDDLQGRRLPRPGFAGPDLARALTHVPADLPRILLAHQPNYFREAAGRVALQLSGHTHGGQLRPLTTPVTAFWDFVHGRYERQGSTLYVNRGFGTSGPPSRVGAPPEITRIVLVSG